MRELIKAFDARKKTFSNDVSEVKFDLPTGNLDKLNIPGKLKEGELTITRYVSHVPEYWTDTF
jgi:hypothetical protein